MQCLLKGCPLTVCKIIRFMGMNKLEPLIPAASVLLHQHHRSLCITHIHHAGRHALLFLSVHDLKGDLWSLQIASLFLFLSLSFPTFSFRSMPARCVGFCRLSSSAQCLLQSFLESDCLRCQMKQGMCWM